MLLKRINIILRYKNIEDKVPDIFNLGTVAAIKVRINKVKKITSITNLVTTASLNAKLNEVKNKTTSITNLATNIAFIAIENKIKQKDDAETKADYDAETKDTKNYFITSDYNKFTNNLLGAEITTKS